jgi:hypothetical protein
MYVHVFVLFISVFQPVVRELWGKLLRCIANVREDLLFEVTAVPCCFAVEVYFILSSFTVTLLHSPYACAMTECVVPWHFRTSKRVLVRRSYHLC